MYVDYSYYCEKYKGTVIQNEDEFSWAERKAEAYIRCMTYIHGDIFKTDLDEVRDAVCAAADVCYKNIVVCEKKHINGPLKSETIDGYSASYVTEQKDGQTSEEFLKKKAYEAAYPYLLPTGWLSRKVGCKVW